MHRSHHLSELEPGGSGPVGWPQSDASGIPLVVWKSECKQGSETQKMSKSRRLKLTATGQEPWK